MNWRARTATPFDTRKHPAEASRGMVVTNHPVGSSAGLEMLALGGNAVDAAIAAVFTLSVVEPMMVGPFGGGYINVAFGDGTSLCIDNYTTAPAAATPDMYQPVSDTWPDYLRTEDRLNEVGHLSVGVPGNLRAWDEVQALHGRLPWETVLAPAIRHAHQGFRASDYLSRLVADHRGDIARFAATAEIFLPDGEPLSDGDLVVRHEFGESLEAIAAGRSAVLHEGALGSTIVDHMARHGGLITMEDMSRYETVHRDPVRGTYRGHEISGPPPGNSGIALIIEMLNILEGYDIADMGFGTVDGVHVILEVLKIAFADRFAHLGDPATVDIPLEWLTSKDYGTSRRADIDMSMAKAVSSAPASSESSYTTHLTTADVDGTVVSMTQTINALFGSKVTVPGTGILLNNTQAMFDPHPGHPNSVAPNKRVVSSMAPAVVSRDGRPWLGIGTPGGVRIFPAVLQALVNLIDHGMTLQEAVDAPRVWTQGQTVEVESAFGESVRSELAGRGHDLIGVPNVAGGMNGIAIDHTAGTMVGAACWRADGAPAGLAGGFAGTEVRFRPIA